MRDGATALAQARSETTIEVELPGRSYAIVIGEHLLASAGQRIAAALPGARCRRGDRRQCRGAVSAAAARRASIGKAYCSARWWWRRAKRARASPCWRSSASSCSSSASSAATASSPLAAAWSATSPASPPASCGAASASCRCRPRCWPRSIPRSAARPASTRRQGKNLIGTFHQPSLVLADIAVLVDARARASSGRAMPRW